MNETYNYTSTNFSSRYSHSKFVIIKYYKCSDIYIS